MLDKPGGRDGRCLAPSGETGYVEEEDLDRKHRKKKGTGKNRSRDGKTGQAYRKKEGGVSNQNVKHGTTVQRGLMKTFGRNKVWKNCKGFPASWYAGVQNRIRLRSLAKPPFG